MNLLALICLSFGGGYFGALLVKQHGVSVGLVDKPNVRSSHQLPTPKGGGVGITLTVTLVAMIFIPVHLFLLAVVFCLAAFALVDDLKGLSIKLRFGIQIMAAAMVILLYRQDLFINGLTPNSAWRGLAMVALLFFVVATTNFFNFMDGINGIAGFEAVISFLSIAIFHLLLTENQSLFLLSISICATTAGFLLLNFPRARVFMGDVGSIFLGFLFAVLVLISARNIKEFIFLTIFQAIFYIDCAATIVLRKIRRENVFAAHRFHLYQELVHEKGWSHARVTLTYAAVQVLITAVAWLILPLTLTIMILFWFLLMVLYAVLRVGFFKVMNRISPSKRES